MARRGPRLQLLRAQKHQWQFDRANRNMTSTKTSATTSQLQDVPGMVHAANGMQQAHPKKFTVDVPDALMQDLKGSSAVQITCCTDRPTISIYVLHVDGLQLAWAQLDIPSSWPVLAGRWAQSAPTYRQSPLLWIWSATASYGISDQCVCHRTSSSTGVQTSAGPSSRGG